MSNYMIYSWALQYVDCGYDKALYNGSVFSIATLSISKACDRLSHYKFLLNLMKYGIPINNVMLFKYCMVYAYICAFVLWEG